MEFQVIFESLGTKTPEERELIKKNLIEKFKVPAEKAERMISHAPIVVKKGLTEEQAKKYKSALESIGARASIRSIENREPETIKPSSDKLPSEKLEAPAPAVSQDEPSVTEPVPKSEVITKSDLEPVKQSQPEQDFLVYQHDFNAQADPTEKAPPAPAPAPSIPIDPYKTQVSSRKTDQQIDRSSSQMPETPTGNQDDLPTRQQPAVTEAPSAGQWWETARVLNPPFDESAPSVTPITSGRVSTQPRGFSVSHPMINQIHFEEILLISVFQIGMGAMARQFIDIFISSLTRPARVSADLIDYSTFGIPNTEPPEEQLASFVKYLLEHNRNIAIDLSTYRFLKDKERIKVVKTDRNIEKYCGKLQSEVEKGLDQKWNENVISWREASELFDEADPWADPWVTPPAPGYPPATGPQPGLMDMPPGAYNTQPIRPPGTATPIAPNAPPPMQPQPYQPPAPGYAPPVYAPPQNYAPPPAPNAPPFGMPPLGQAQGYQPESYPGPGQYHAPPMPGQFPVPGQMPGMAPGYGYANPAMEFEITKARDGAQTALILSIIGLVPCGCFFPLSILGIIKAQDALRVMDTYGIQDDRNKAAAAKIIAIVGLIINALILMFKIRGG